MCDFFATGGNSTPYCTQSNMMPSHHNFCQAQGNSDQIGSGDGQLTRQHVLDKGKIQINRNLFPSPAV